MASLPESEIHGSPPDIRNQGKWHEILEKLLACTGASGAVVLLLSNDTLSCKATAGTTVPDLGTRLEQNTSITALCFRTGETLICEDSELDTRVNTEACRVLRIRSLLAFALKRRNAVIGVLELLSRNPQTFGEQHIPLINRFAHQFLQLALADVDHEESSYKIEASDEPPEFLSRQTKEEFSKQEEQNRGAESLQLALENYEQRFASSRLPALVAATVTLTGLMILGLQLPTLWRSLRSPLREPATAITPAARSESAKQGQTTEMPSVLSAPAEDVVKKIKGHTASSDSFETLQRKANSNQARAAYELALRYATGEGVGQNYTQAMNWFARAAAKGNASAQWKIGLGYLKGIGMPQNDKRAAEWFKRAANQGHIGAQFALSEMYLRGCGVPVDYVRAYTWAAISLRTSNQGEQQLRNIEGLLTPSELQGANMRIGVWWGRHTNATLR